MLRSLIRPLRLSTATLFSVGLGAIVLVSVGTILVISTISARVGLVEGLAAEYDLAIGSLIAKVEDHLGAAEAQTAFLAGMVARTPQVITEPGLGSLTLQAALAAAPQVAALALIGPDGRTLRVERADGAAITSDLARQPEIMAWLQEAEAAGPFGPPLPWTPPMYSPILERRIVMHPRPLWSPEGFMGLLVAAVDLRVLSERLADVSAALGHPVFLLRDDRDVVAHSALAQASIARGPDLQNPRIDTVPDRRLAAIWLPDRNPVIARDRMQRSDGHWFRADGLIWIYIYGQTRAFGDRPWRVGFHFDSNSDALEVRRFWVVLSAGAALLIGFVGIGAWLGQRLARPVRQLTDNAIAIQQLDLSRFTPMRRSRVIEMDQAGQAFEAMVGALRGFARYVPRRLVERILADGPEATPAEARAITVLFVDMVGFTGLAERLTPQETAAFLNDHFRRLGRCIDAEGGTIDKYIGDGLLAFWGAPEPVADHAGQACAAALAIRRAVADDNARRRTDGRPAIRWRVGIHTGPAIVGDIGAESRLNYTAIGDTVNIASRVEAMAREHMSDAVTILATEATVTAARRPLAAEPLGPITLRGRSDAVKVYRL